MLIKFSTEKLNKNPLGIIKELNFLFKLQWCTVMKCVFLVVDVTDN
jgi:hypothetical protein